MKKILVKPVIFLTLIASMLFVSSCEEAAEVVEADLIGTWEIGNPSVDVMVGPVKLKDFLMSTMSFGRAAAEEIVDQITAELTEFGGGTITFNTDYTYQMAQSKFEESGTWKLEDDKLYMKVAEEIEEGDPLTVQSMSSSAAVIAWEEEQEIEIEEGINPIKATIVFELPLTK